MRVPVAAVIVMASCTARRATMPGFAFSVWGMMNGMAFKPKVPARRPAGQRPWRHWLYTLALLPVLTDVIETGRWPAAPREWVTEFFVGAVVLVLVRAINKEHATLLAISRTDALTGLGNRRAFEEALEGECMRAQRTQQPLSLVCIDLDQFKWINDRDGHAAGDKVLQHLAQAIFDVARAHVDRGFRIGGDEFALLLPGASVAEAQAVIARIRAHCASADAVWREGLLGLSAGYASLGGQETPSAFLCRADAAMYDAKQARRGPSGAS
jgi:diguanylate cyclase (GGDEF)-like protein